MSNRIIVDQKYVKEKVYGRKPEMAIDEIIPNNNAYREIFTDKKDSYGRSSGGGGLLLFERILIYSVLLMLLGGMTYGLYMGYQYMQVFEGNFDNIDNRLDIYRNNFDMIDKETTYIYQMISDLGEQIDDLDQSLQYMEEDKKQLEMRNRSLQSENEGLEEDRKKLEDEKEELTELLSMRYKTYQTALSRQGANHPVLTPSGFSARQFDDAWKKLGADGLVGTGEAFVRAEAQTGVNALVLASIAAHESGFGRSRIARDKKNLYGFGAYDSSPYDSAHNFSSFQEGTIKVAEFLSRNYLSRSGRYYQGDNLYSINTYYATSQDWAEKVAGMMRIIAEASVDKKTIDAWKKYLG